MCDVKGFRGATPKTFQSRALAERTGVSCVPSDIPEGMMFLMTGNFFFFFLSLILMVKPERLGLTRFLVLGAI